MVRTLTPLSILSQRHGPRRGGTAQRVGRATARLVTAAAFILNSGCAIVPRERMDECQRLTQTLRSENARLKDRVLALQGQNRDYAERAVDDSRRLAIQDEAIERLERGVQAYQDERNRLEAAYQQLASNLEAAGAQPGERLGLGGSQARRGSETGSPRRARLAGTSGGEDGREGP
jgi:hypothetical protein